MNFLLIQWIVLFVLALAVVIKSADYFTEAAERIGLHFHIPPFIIGVTIVAFGTSLPEVVTSVSAAMRGETALVINNVVGSNHANILLVLGVAAIVGKNIKVNKDIVTIDLPIVLSSIIMLFILTIDGKLTYLDGIILFLALVGYILYNIYEPRSVDSKDASDISKLKKSEKKKLSIKHPLILFASAGFLWFSADFTILSVLEISHLLHINPELMAITAVAIGTSLPELVVSTIAAKKGKADMAIGNVMGSNIFNALGVTSIPAFFTTLSIPPEILSFGIPVLLFVTILYVFTTMDKQVSKWEGIMLVGIYLAIVGHLIGVV